MRTSYSKNIYMFLLVILFVGIICGLFLTKHLDSNLQLIIKSSISTFFDTLKDNKLNFILLHLITLSVIVFSSFIVIGIPLGIIYTFYNGVSIGFIINSFFVVKGIKGCIFALIYIIISKGMYLLLLFLIFSSILRTAYFIGKYILKKDSYSKDKVLVLIKKVFLCSLLVVLNDILIFFVAGNILNIFNFLLN